jgi:hypothetical protein
LDQEHRKAVFIKENYFQVYFTKLLEKAKTSGRVEAVLRFGSVIRDLMLFNPPDPGSKMRKKNPDQGSG